MNRKSLTIHQLVPGQTYRVEPHYKGTLRLHDGMGIYQGYTLNFNCKSAASAYSPDMKYFDTYKNNIIVDPNTVKIGDIITIRNKWNPVNSIDNVTVTKIEYIYEFSKFSPPLPYHSLPICLYSNETTIYESAQTLMELRVLKELDTIKLTVIPDGHNPRVLIDDVLNYMKQFIAN